MKHTGIVTLAALAAVLGGCANTLQGARQDASQDTQGVRAAAHKAGAAVSTAGKNAVAAGENVTAAAALTPRIKLAIIRDPILNDGRNQINVNSTQQVVYLKGHVFNQDMKQRAQEDAAKILQDHHSPATVNNELKVSGG